MRRSASRLAIAAIFALPFRGSGDEKKDDVTYSRDIAPLLQEKCVECHRQGGGAPFSLLTFKDASRRARTLLQVVDDRYMPPWHAIGATSRLRATGVSNPGKST